MSCLCPTLFAPKMVNQAIEGDNYHMGHLLIESLSRKPEAICQIDAATGEQETYASVLSRSKRLAKTLRTLGLKPGDILALGGKNHLDIHIPHYAGLLNGYPVCGVDPLYKFGEIKKLLEIVKPKIAFCQPETYNDYTRAVKELGLNTKIFTFGDGERSMRKLIEKSKDDNLEPAKFDKDKVYAWMASTSGTTGTLKIAAYKHQVAIESLTLARDLMVKMSQRSNQQSPSAEQKAILNLSPVQWISGFFNAMNPLMNGYIKLQTSAPVTTEHVIDIINKYKPVSALFSPSLAKSILQSEKHCDFSCLNNVTLAGAKSFKDDLMEIQSRLKNGFVMEGYGCTECLGPMLLPNPMGPLGNCGKALNPALLKLVDPEMEKEITEADVAGELWYHRGLRFTEYYNNPEETSKAFTSDGWYKTGDLLRRDKDGNYYFVERLKLLIKYRGYQIIPPQLEEVIMTLEGVAEAAVTGIAHPEDGHRAVACVVRKPGANVTAQEIKDIVASKLSDSKQLRGGVVFLDQLPMTSSGKIARAKLQELVKTANRE